MLSSSLFKCTKLFIIVEGSGTRWFSDKQYVCFIAWQFTSVYFGAYGLSKNDFQVVRYFRWDEFWQMKKQVLIDCGQINWNLHVLSFFC